MFQLFKNIMSLFVIDYLIKKIPIILNIRKKIHILDSLEDDCI
jgi:hypothetical protein